MPFHRALDAWVGGDIDVCFLDNGQFIHVPRENVLHQPINRDEQSIQFFQSVVLHI